MQKKENKKNDDKNFAHAVISWYPGHMAKTMRQISEDLKLVDVVVEILDSRIPISSQNPDISDITKNKDKIIIMNKSDLADKKQNTLWVEYFKSKGIIAILTDCNAGKGINEVLRTIEKIKQEELQLYALKGRAGRKIRAMVLRNSKCSENHHLLIEFQKTTI